MKFSISKVYTQLGTDLNLSALTIPVCFFRVETVERGEPERNGRCEFGNGQYSHPAVPERDPSVLHTQRSVSQTFRPKGDPVGVATRFSASCPDRTVSGLHEHRQREEGVSHCRQTSVGYRKEIPRLHPYESVPRYFAVVPIAEDPPRECHFEGVVCARTRRISDSVERLPVFDIA